jgi:hypothetical protein
VRPEDFEEGRGSRMSFSVWSPGLFSVEARAGMNLPFPHCCYVENVIVVSPVDLPLGLRAQVISEATSQTPNPPVASVPLRFKRFSLLLQDLDGETQMGRAEERKLPEGWKSLGVKTF